jgi:hypothetical protein
MDIQIEKKLLIKPGKSVVLLNAPIGFDTEMTTDKKINADVVIAFVKSKKDVDQLSSRAIRCAKEDGVLWFAYPKINSGIRTDINRDNGWDSLRKEKFEAVTQIAIDTTWSALRFRSIAKIPKMIRQIQSGAVLGQKADRVLVMPAELKELLNKNPQAKKFFDTLSFTNCKEYTVWISSAKLPETKMKRLGDTLAKLLASKKNPSEK